MKKIFILAYLISLSSSAMLNAGKSHTDKPKVDLTPIFQQATAYFLAHPTESSYDYNNLVTVQRWFKNKGNSKLLVMYAYDAGTRVPIGDTIIELQKQDS